MKNWKKLLACLLVGLMALTVFTACDASVGAPMGPKPSDAASAKALCDRFKKTYSVELSEKAYSIANWVAGTSVSCDTSKDKTEFYRVVKANNEARASLKEEKYATAFENLSMGAFGPDNFVPGFEQTVRSGENDRADAFRPGSSGRKRNDAEGSGRSSGNFPVVYFPAGKENHDKAQTGNDPV